VAAGKYDTDGAGCNHAVSAVFEAPLGTGVSALGVPPIAILPAFDSDLAVVSLVLATILEGRHTPRGGQQHGMPPYKNGLEESCQHKRAEDVGKELH